MFPILCKYSDFWKQNKLFSCFLLLVGTFFGTDRAYTLTDFLEDGVHTGSVAVQNVYGLFISALAPMMSTSLSTFINIVLLK